MVERETFTAVCERDLESGWWIVTVPELPGVVTQGKNLVEARAMAEDAIALWQERRKGSFEVVIDVQLPAAADRPGPRRFKPGQADRAQEQAATATREAIRALIEEQGLTVRDVAQLLGTSYQRVAQLAPSRARVG